MSSEKLLQLRIVTAEYYSAPPFPHLDDAYNHFRGAVIKQLPVIRIFGITNKGDKGCLHVHGVLPYLYIRYPSSIADGKKSSLLYEIADSLDQALNNSLGMKKQHVFKVSTLPSKSFYGYHSEDEVFVKICLYDPSSVSRAASLFLDGAVCGQPLQPFEAHLPYILQFFIDYNLYGMNFINISEWSDRCSDTERGGDRRAKESNCTLEVDVSASAILNVSTVAGVVNPGLNSIREEEEQRNEEDGVVGFVDSHSEERTYTPTDSDIKFQQQLSLAIKNRCRSEEVSIVGEQTFDGSSSTSQQNAGVVFDDEDVSVLKLLLEKVVSDDLPDEDSVLAATQEEENLDDNNEELSQPYVSFIVDSDEECSTDNNWDMSESMLWPEVEGLSQVDGNPDDPKSSPKSRYRPLDVTLHTSPRRPNKGKILMEEGSPHLFRKLEESVRRLRSVRSPKTKLENTGSEVPPGTSAELRDKDISRVSDSSENENVDDQLNYIIVENSSRRLDSFPKEIRCSAKKALFASSDSFRDPCNKGDYLEQESSCIDNGTSKTCDMDRPCISDQSTPLTNYEEDMGDEFSGFRSAELDTTNASQCTVLSFYGETTLCVERSRVLTPVGEPPSRKEVYASLDLYGLATVSCVAPRYGDASEGPSFKEVGGNLKSRHLDHIEEFRSSFSWEGWPPARHRKATTVFEPAEDPPSSTDIRRAMTQSQPFLSNTHKNYSVKHKFVKLDRKARQSGDIEYATPNNSGMFKLDFEKLQDAQLNSLHRWTTVMTVELHTSTRADLRPDPEYDPVEAVFYSIVNDVPPLVQSNTLPMLIGVIMVCTEYELKQYPFSCSVTSVATEVELFTTLIRLVHLHNPDILAGYEIEMLSWGYLIERGFVMGLNLLNELSRVKSLDGQRLRSCFSKKDYDLRIPGRIVLNVWKLMRHEVALQSYTLESMAYHVLHTRIPTFSFKTLTAWWNQHSKRDRILVLKHYLTVVDAVGQLLDQLDLVGRTSELAGLFGIQFYEVFSRGSQFRVESMMLRIAKRLGFIAVSPSIKQRSEMRAPESLPLIMEPESRLYTDPVIVLDFQSLYPSMIIAYNYCFSTCIGRVADLIEKSQFKFGCTELHVPLKELLRLERKLHVSPAGVAFVDKTVRHGVLPQMLQQILETRLMVKESLKRHKSNKLLKRVLHARQLGLKLIANVTYGYTSANFSGRMPCIEVGDSVVSKGRETLERAIQLVDGTPKWSARVVYGDTDSLFVHCPGRSREEAFRIGQEIADAVTAANPKPVKLKLEKVYQPCILQTKKRYVGYMYESEEQEKPEFDAKGIETVRRDGCPATSKILEKSLKILFDTLDVSEVKKYVIGQITKVLSGRLSPAELVFAKEYRGASGYMPSAVVPCLKIARELARRDRRAEPRTGERVRYVVTCGPPGLPLIALVRGLTDFLDDPAYSLNADYYIAKAILPPLHRCFSLFGADVFSWYSGLPKKQLVEVRKMGVRTRRATIAQYLQSRQCLACASFSCLPLCPQCTAEPSHTLPVLLQTISKLEAKHHLFDKVCGSCCGRRYETDCKSLDCPVFYRLRQASLDKMHCELLLSTANQLSHI